MCLVTKILLISMIISTKIIYIESCNELVCGSIVSKCLLTQSCQCKLNDCFCCKDCLHCMSSLFMECCICLNLCPAHNETLNVLATKSQIADFPDGIPELFDTLTAESDDDKWTTIRIPINLNFLVGGGQPNINENKFFEDTDEIDLYSAALKHPILDSTKGSLINCTMIFVNRCLSNVKCLEFCSSMGSTKNRWFHDGCCECIGSTCINYGLNENRCSHCPELDEEEEAYDSKADYSEEQWDYGEDDFW